MSNPRILSVTEVNQYLKTLIGSNSILKSLSIQGELSNVKKVASGHIYFSLKDAGSRIDCVMFKNVSHGLKYNPIDGMKVTIRGSLGVYTPSGRYQITVRSMEEKGQGDLYQAFLALKDKFERQGYFSIKNKKKMPKTVNRVGIVTSATGAAIEDMISIIHRRNALIDIVIYPSLVQSDKAAKNISAGIEAFNALESVDVIIIGRGGGSIEDLWAFNDEELGKTIFNSKLPLISAVGHETDFTLSDFVADLRAPTPSGAAELVAEETQNYSRDIDHLDKQIRKLMIKEIQKNREKLVSLNRELIGFHPQEHLDELRLHIDQLNNRMMRSIKGMIKDKRLEIKHYKSQLKSTNPLNVLNRGYVLVIDDCGKVIGSVDRLQKNQTLKLKFKDGSAEVCVKSIKEKK
jgi:exodeoxyribonuclease VII large subunit